MKGFLLVLVFIVAAIFAQVRSSSSIFLADLQRLERKTTVWSRDVDAISFAASLAVLLHSLLALLLALFVQQPVYVRTDTN